MGFLKLNFCHLLHAQVMNKISKIIKSSAYGLIIMAVIPALFHLLGAVRAYSDRDIILKVTDNSSASITKAVQLGMYTNERTLGTLQIKPTMFQSLLLYNEHFSDHGANVIFFLDSRHYDADYLKI